MRRVYRKYHNHKIKTEDGVFDSKKEFLRWQLLRDMERQDLISDLGRQVAFELIPKQVGEDGKVIERSVKYIADFVYKDRGRLIVEDAKGVRTPEYVIKRKLMLQKYGIRIEEV